MTQQVPTRLGTIIPDRIEVFAAPSIRWVLEHKVAYAPGIVALTINPTVSTEELVRASIKDLLIGIEPIDSSHSALLFRFPVAGDVAYTDKVDPSRVMYHYRVDTSEGYYKEFYKPSDLVGFEVTISHYLYEGEYKPFDYRQLTRWSQTEEKCVIEFSENMPPMSLVLHRRCL